MTAGAGGLRRAVTALIESTRLMDGIAVAFLAAGLASALLSRTELPAGAGECLLVAALCVALLVACTLRWWVAPVLAALAVAAGAAAGFALRLLREWAAFATSFLFWLSAGAQAAALYQENGSYRLLQVLVVFALALGCFALVRRLFFYPLLAVGAAAVLVYTAVSGRAEVTGPLCLCAVGLVMLLPRVYAGALARAARKAPAQEPAGGQKPAAMRARMQFLALAVGAAAVGLALLVTPADTSGWRSSALNNLAEDLSRMVEGPFAQYPSQTSNYTLEGVGFGDDSGRLGGPATLSDTLMLTVEAPRPVLLKGRVLDSYTGTAWRVGEADGDLRYDSLLWRGYRREALGTALPRGGGEIARLYEALSEEIEVSVRHRQQRYNSIFYAGRLRDLRLLNLADEVRPYFNLRGELYLHYRLTAQSGYAFTTRVWNTGAEDFEAGFLQLEALCAGQADPDWETVAGRYLALPEELPGEVRQVADMIAGGMETPYLKAAAIARWLAENCSYTLEPEMPPEEADFVAYFLQTREGYCTYYASAMAVLARCAGLPSRYVQGFALQAEDGGAYSATGRTAHAWAEVYLHGVGWVPFDPLAWDAGAPLNEAPAREEPPAQPAQGFVPAPSEEPSEPEDGGQPLPAQQQGRGGVGFLVAVAVLPALLLVLWLLWHLAMKSKFRAYSPRRVARKYAAPADRLRCYYRDILRQLALLDIDFEPGETLTVFAGGLDRRLRFEGAPFAPVAEAVNLLVFAEAGPEAAQVEAAARYHRQLEEHLLQSLGKGRYFIRRALPPARL